MKGLYKFLVQNYLRLLTKITLWRHQPLIVAVAGTTNKTFVKEMILQELGNGPEIRGNPKSFNTEIGLPLAVLFLPSGNSSISKWADVLLTGTCVSLLSMKFPKILVLELGVDRQGDMKYLLSMVKPKIAVVTTIDKSFPDNNTSLDDIAKEIRVLVENVPPDGLLLLNGDDNRVFEQVKYAKSRRIVYGQSPQADARIENIQETAQGQNFDLVWQGETRKIETGRFGQHNLEAQAIAKIVAHEIVKY